MTVISGYTSKFREIDEWMDENDVQRTSSRAPTPDTTIDSNVSNEKRVGIENRIPASIGCCRDELEFASIMSRILSIVAWSARTLYWLNMNVAMLHGRNADLRARVRYVDETIVYGLSFRVLKGNRKVNRRQITKVSKNRSSVRPRLKYATCAVEFAQSGNNSRKEK